MIVGFHFFVSQLLPKDTVDVDVVQKISTYTLHTCTLRLFVLDCVCAWVICDLLSTSSHLEDFTSTQQNGKVSHLD